MLNVQQGSQNNHQGVVARQYLICSYEFPKYSAAKDWCSGGMSILLPASLRL